MDLGFGIGTDRRIFETYLNRCNMGLNPPEHARLGLRCGSLVLGWHRLTTAIATTYILQKTRTAVECVSGFVSWWMVNMTKDRLK